MKKKKGFTLVELLAVIVILAVILIIAMPKISDVIKNSKEASLETTAKLIASQAEKKYTENQVLDGNSAIKCSDVAKISDADYESCNITFDSKGNAKVTIVGKGKFEGMAVYDGTKDSAKASTKKDIVETAAKYFSYEEVSDEDYGIVKTTTISSFEVEDVNKCKTYFMNYGYGITEEQATTLCNGGSTTVDKEFVSLKLFLSAGVIQSSDYETAGLKVENMDIIVENVTVENKEKCVSYLTSISDGKQEQATTLCTGGIVDGYPLSYDVQQGYIPSLSYDLAGLNVTYRPYTPSISITGYNIEGGTDVVIPSMIDGKTVVAIAGNAFTTQGVIPEGISNTNNNYQIKKLNYSGSNNYVVKRIEASVGLGIKSVVIPDTVKTIGNYAFYENQLTSIVIPSSVTYIGAAAFGYNQIKSITFPTTPITILGTAFVDNPITEDGTYTYPDNVTINNPS